MNLTALKSALRATAKPGDAEVARRYFKTGPGEYGEGDVFLGVRAGPLRALAKQGDELSQADVLRLLRSPIHEERSLALLLLVRRFERGDEAIRQRIYDLYLRETRWINNWDLVDVSAPNIVGGWLLGQPRGGLRKLARSPVLWERRIAVVATLTLIRAGQFADTLAVCRLLLRDPHDLIHKACGWMLREAGKRDVAILRGFLEQHAAAMPRTMLRYAIERLPEDERRAWMAARPKSCN